MKIKDRAKPKLPPLEPGTYPAVCVGVIDLGEQYSERFKNYSNKLKIVWEIPSETVEVDGEQKPRQLSRDFTFSASAKSGLRQILQSWTNRSLSDEDAANFEVFDLLGKPCLLSVVRSESGEYANVQSVVAMPKGIPAPTTSTPLLAWDMDKWDDAGFASMPEWYQEVIKKSTQYQKQHAPTDEIKVDPATGEIAPASFTAGAATASTQGEGKGGVPF